MTKAKPPAPGVDADALGALLNLDAAEVRRLARAGVLPKAKRRRWEPYDAIRAYVAHLQAETLRPDARVTAEFVADVLGITPRYVRLKTSEGPLERVEGRYVLRDTVRAYLGALKPTGTPLQLEGARLKRAQAERAELDNARDRGELMPRGEVAQAVAAIMVELAQALDGLASTIAEDAAARERATFAIRRARAVAAERLRALADGGGEGPTAAAE